MSLECVPPSRRDSVSLLRGGVREPSSVREPLILIRGSLTPPRGRDTLEGEGASDSHQEMSLPRERDISSLLMCLSLECERYIKRDASCERCIKREVLFTQQHLDKEVPPLSSYFTCPGTTESILYFISLVKASSLSTSVSA